jgi:hypothetical protein
MIMKTGDEILQEALSTFLERKATYGLNYLTIGKVLEIMFPDGVVLKTAEDHNKWHLFLMAQVKMTRQAAAGLNHADSARDACVYSAMFEGLISETESESLLE